MTIIRFIITSVLFFLELLPAAASPAFMIAFEAVPDTARLDTVLIKPDSALPKIPAKSINTDTTFQRFQGSPWQMSRADMNQYFYEDLGDLLIYLPGFYLYDFGSSGQSLWLRRHGANEQQTTIFFDGRPLYDPIHGGIDLNLIPVGFTNSITIEEGLSSSALTSNAEIVSFTSPSYETEQPYSQVGYHKAPYGFSDIDIIFGQKVSPRISVVLGGIIKSYDGQTDAYRFDQQNFRGRIDYQVTPTWQFGYGWISNNIKRHLPNPKLADSSFQLTDASQKVSRLDQTLTIKGRIFKSDYPNFRANLFYSSSSDKIADKIANVGLTNLAGYAGLNAHIQQRIMGQSIATGTDLIHEWADADQFGNQNQTFGSIFIQDDWQWREKLGLRILGNYQFHSIHGSQFSGGLSGGFAIAKNARIFAATRQAIHYPTFFEMKAQTNFIGNPDLKPESHRKIEIGINWDWAAKFSLKSSFYSKTIDRPIQFNPLDSAKATLVNQDQLRYAGFDLELIGQLGSHWRFNNLLSVIDNGNLVDQPDIMLNSYLQYSDSFFQDDVRPTLRLEGRYVGARTSQITHPYLYARFQTDLASALILNAHAMLDFGNLKIFITLENMLDQNYQLIYGYPMNKRVLHYGLRWEFWN